MATTTDAARPAFDAAHLPAGADPLGPSDPRELGGYRLVGRLGAGGMGAVYAGVDAAGRCAAVKIIHPELAANPEFLARFARETDLVRRVRATCTAEFHGADTTAATPWLATEYVPGPTLRQHVTEHGPLAGGMLLAFATGLAEALEAIHTAGVVHRDLKPGNVILSPTGPKVLDFGIARAAEETALTATGALVGTPGWLAPELYAGAPPSPAADVFALGGLVAFAATGRNPFGTGTPEVLSYRTRNEPPDLDGLPDDLRPFVTAALDRDPERRPTAAEALAALTGTWTATHQLPDTTTGVVPAIMAVEWGGIAIAPPRPLAPALRWTPVAAAAAIVVVLVLSGWTAGRVSVDAPLLPTRDTATTDAGTAGDSDDTDGATEDESADDGDNAEQVDPEDAPAALEQAIELARDASSFEAVRINQGIDRPTLGSTTATYRYTEDPEPAFHFRDVGEGAYYEEALGLGEGQEEVVFRRWSDDYYRDPDAGERELALGDRDSAFETLLRIADTSDDIAYVGAEELEAGPASRDAMELVGEEGHRYSGTFTSLRWDFNEETNQTEQVPWENTPFDLWIGADGRPLRVQYIMEGVIDGAEEIDVVDETAYLHFDEHVSVDVPDESDILPEPPEDLGP